MDSNQKVAFTYRVVLNIGLTVASCLYHLQNLHLLIIKSLLRHNAKT